MESSRTYGCHNQPRSQQRQVAVQDGWTEDGRRVMRFIDNFAYQQPCKYDQKETDLRCKGCYQTMQGV